MASIVSRENGTKYIQLTNIDKKRYSIWLGEISKRDAERVRDKIEQLVRSRRLALPVPAEVETWVRKLPEELSKRLAELNLIDRVEPKAVPTVGEFLAEFVTRRGEDVKGGTLVFYGHTIRNLKAFFGDDRRLDEINPGDADDFRRYLAKTEKLADATVVRRCTLARTFFKDAVRRKLINSNPFDGVGKGSTANPDRQRFIDRETISKVIDACPNAEWRLLVALSRFGGLRVPSEPLLLRWQDVDTVNWKTMLVHSPKTEHHAGKGSRKVPIFPELLPYLKEAYELAEDGAEFVLPSLRRPGIATGDWRNVNFGTMFIKIIKRAGLTPWPRVWHNLRSSRQTELTELFPSHVVTAWLGNSERVAEKHYLQVLDSHFEKATSADCMHSCMQNGVERAGIGLHTPQAGNEKAPENQGLTASYVSIPNSKMGDEGFEPPTSTV
jgi:integrase